MCVGKIRLAAYLQPDSIVDGEGIRTVIWTQGCPHNCKGCHNPETHDFSGGALIELSEIYSAIDKLEGQDGITFSGGDPFLQPHECALIAKYAKSKGYNIWTYTGYTFEQLLKLSEVNHDYMDFLKEIDVLIDGKFELLKKSYNSVFRGSTNQRIIDVKTSIVMGRAVSIEKYDSFQELNHKGKIEGIYV
jgi:anaerobic ribonucleoside-triphosphate reductase activating protein